MPRPILLATTSDQHAGSTVALCPDFIRLDDGGEYHASTVQRWLMQCWRDYWAAVAAKRRALKADLYVVLNGDLVEGDHHKSTQIMSANPNAQAAAWNAVIAVPLALKPDRIVIVRGTGAHAGVSACSEERIADGLRRDKRPIIADPESGAASWWHWRAELHGVLVDVAHHGRIGRREHTRSSQAALYANDIFLAHTKAKHRHPDLCLRGHNHKIADSSDACPTRVVATGAWQVASEHVHKVQPDSLADINGCLVTIDAGQYEVDKITYTPDRPIWRPE